MTTETVKSQDYQVLRLCVEAMKGGGFLGSGDLSALRRQSPEAPHPVFWRILAKVNMESEEEGALPPWKERDLAFAIKCMAVMAPFHAGDDHPGRALARAGFSSSGDIRISRLLKASGEPFRDYLLAACRYMKSRQAGWNWNQFYRLASSRPEDRERAAFARSFYI